MVRRNSSVGRLGSPLDLALVNGEVLRVKKAYRAVNPLHVGLLCRATGGTRGTPTCTFIGVQLQPVDIDKQYLQRARLPAGTDVEAAGRLAAAAYLASIVVQVS